jgi:hypothetical protein
MAWAIETRGTQGCPHRNGAFQGIGGQSLKRKTAPGLR